MIKKTLGIDEKSIVKKSNYYGYLFISFMGAISIVIGISMFIVQYSNTFKTILDHNYKNINYIQQVATNTNDEKLLSTAASYKINMNLIDEFPQQTGLFFILFGFLLISNFILFKELRKKSLNDNASLINSEET